ncbi:IS30 family transposase, partial [Rhizobium sp. PP-CC-3G-465]|uniref:IS30 family transposase n=1 Tax=Rhizobium sp. PP-CC-3G-465 TaxID=2135648 RepID=UPI001FDFBD7E
DDAGYSREEPGAGNPPARICEGEAEWHSYSTTIRYAVLIKNPSRHSRPIMDKIIRAFSPLPAFARQSFTFDRGTEFAGFRALEDGIGACSWFCDPSAPWQKGTVENTNKRIRRYLPGTTDLAVVSQRDLLHLTHHINNQPRKCLGYRTPTEVFTAHLQEGS